MGLVVADRLNPDSGSTDLQEYVTFMLLGVVVGIAVNTNTFAIRHLYKDLHTRA